MIADNLIDFASVGTAPINDAGTDTSIIGTVGTMTLKKKAGTNTGNILTVDTTGLVYDASNKPWASGLRVLVRCCTSRGSSPPG